MRTRPSNSNESSEKDGDEISVEAAPDEAAANPTSTTSNGKKKCERKERRKKTVEGLRRRNLGVGLVIERGSTNAATNKIKFDSDDEFDEETEEHDAEDEHRDINDKDENRDNESGTDSEDDSVEEVALEESRKAVMSQRTAERMTKQSAVDIRGRTSRRKRAKHAVEVIDKEEDDEESNESNDDEPNEIDNNGRQPDANNDPLLNEELFALLDADRISNSKRRKTEPKGEALSGTGKRTTFVVEGQSSSDFEKIKVDYNIELVVLKGANSQEYDIMGSTVGTRPSATALLLSRHGNNLAQGLKRNKKRKYGTKRGRPSKTFSK